MLTGGDKPYQREHRITWAYFCAASVPALIHLNHLCLVVRQKRLIFRAPKAFSGSRVAENFTADKLEVPPEPTC
ncbi:hypothetical protein F5Y16DRAFT_406137 [Xylariaceae sp. FL0255]|nr:hypothetical protein F5Y16DRAFT_406137 [Xylariaceae sp. FL0255]